MLLVLQSFICRLWVPLYSNHKIFLSGGCRGALPMLQAAQQGQEKALWTLGLLGHGSPVSLPHAGSASSGLRLSSHTLYCHGFGG